MISLKDKILYSRYTTPFSFSDASQYSMGSIQRLEDSWKSHRNFQILLRIVTLGIAYFFQKRMTSQQEMKQRIQRYKGCSSRLHKAVKPLQRKFAHKLYERERQVSLIQQDRIREATQKSTGGRVTKTLEVARAWWQSGTIDLFTDSRAQIIWQRMQDLSDQLKKEGYYVFFHSHSYPITLHLELAAHLASTHQSKEYQQEIPLESLRKMRAPGVARHFNNTTSYLRSHLGRMINSGETMDDNHRETIISCDCIPSNNERYESCQFFFKQNKSIVDTPSSTGMKHNDFDLSFLQGYLRTPWFQHYAARQFAVARDALKDKVPPIGMIRVIAIKKETLQDQKTNYVWRSHAFGVLCRCQHERGRFGHKEFVATLDKNQSGAHQRCNNGSLPQYRILASNLDKDRKKQIYTMDCLSETEKGDFKRIFENLKNELTNLVRLEKIPDCKTADELLLALQGIDITEKSAEYREGLASVLRKNAKILENHQEYLRKRLVKNLYNLIFIS